MLTGKRLEDYLAYVVLGRKLPQRERIVLAAELVTDDTEVSGEQRGQGSEQLKSPGQAGH